MTRKYRRSIISMTQYDIMAYLWESPRSTKDLCEFLGVERGTCYVHTDNLRALGYIESALNSGHLCNRKLYKLTKLGKELINSYKMQLAKGDM